MECSMWFIGIQVTIFGVLITVIGIIFPFLTNRKLDKQKEELDQQKKEFATQIKDLIEFKNRYGGMLENQLQKQNEDYKKIVESIELREKHNL